MKKGITFMSLVIMIAIILTLTTTAVISGINSVNNAKKIKFATEMSYVQEIVNSYIDVDYGFDFDRTCVIDLTNSSQDVLQQFSGEAIESNKVTLYELDPELEMLKNLELTYGKKTIGDTAEEINLDVYLYSISTKKVYYAKGLQLNSKIYYTLTDELRNKIDYSEDLESGASMSNIIFTQSTYEWTNLSVSCELKVPKKTYDISDFKVYLDNSEVSVNSQTTSYYVYILDANGNCNVKVTDSSGQNIIKTYDVSNIDKIAPTLELGNITKVFDSETNELKRSVQISNKYDNESGIKWVKYELTKIPLDNVKSYFASNGIVLNSDSITIPNDVENITVYIEDNAGNYNVIIK